jgi:hypothetical protein
LLISRPNEITSPSSALSQFVAFFDCLVIGQIVPRTLGASARGLTDNAGQGKTSVLDAPEIKGRQNSLDRVRLSITGLTTNLVV